MSDKDIAVLIVDDDEDICDLVATTCNHLKLPTHAVSTTKLAQQWLGENKPSLVILDIMMPGGNGLDLCAWIRKQKKFEKLPIIIMSGIKDDETVMDALELGAVDFLRKPYSIKMLEEKIVRLREKYG